MAALPLDMLTLILDHAPFGALNGMLRSCRVMSTIHVDPTKWVTARNGYDGMNLVNRRALPNRVMHGESRTRSMCQTYEVVIEFDRGRVTTGFAFQQNRCIATWNRQAGPAPSWTVTRDGQTAPWLFGEPSSSFIIRWITVSQACSM